MGPVSFTRYTYQTRTEALDAAQALTKVGVRIQIVDNGTTLLVRSEDQARSAEILDGLSIESLAIEPLRAPFDAVVDVPGSKSHTNRALLCAALADGQSTLTRVLLADDTEAMVGALADLGVPLQLHSDSSVSATATVDGVGNAGFRADDQTDIVDIDVRMSGTTSRFLLPALAAGSGRFRLDGHPQVRARPFGPQVAALRSLGAVIDGVSLPLEIVGTRLHGGLIEVTGDVSSQFLSGLLLAAPTFAAPTEVRVNGDLVSKPYVNLTIHTMAAFGIEVDADIDLGRFAVPVGTYQPAELQLEPDASAASYFFAAAAITGSRVRVDGLGQSTIQGDIRFVSLLEEMGASVTVADSYTEVQGTGQLHGITTDMADISDTAQTLAVVAACADSPTEITGVGFIRHKETDRIAASVTELNRLGVGAEETDDGFVIRPGPIRPSVVQTYEDHRMAMSFALLGLRIPGIAVADPGCVAKTFPNFFEVLDSLRRTGGHQ